MKNKGYILAWIGILFGNIIIGSATEFGIVSKIAIASNLYIIAALSIEQMSRCDKKLAKPKKAVRTLQHKNSEYESETELRAV